MFQHLRLFLFSGEKERRHLFGKISFRAVLCHCVSGSLTENSWFLSPNKVNAFPHFQIRVENRFNF
jgi:hypothetical protein